MPDLLPDSRLKQPSGVQRVVNVLGSMNWVPIFCANCGRDGGMVPEENMTFAFWLCDNCFEEHGAIAGTMAVPDEKVFGAPKKGG